MAASYLVGTVLGGGLALLVGVLLGEGPETDSFLAAYSLYLVFILFGSNLRVSLVPIMGSALDEDRLRVRASDALARLTAVGAALALAALVTSPLLGRLLTTGSPNVAVQTLALLSVATYCQIAAAALSAVLAAGRRFTASAGLYVASSAVTLLLAVVLMPPLGALGAALGIVGGALVLYGGHVVVLSRHGFGAPPRARAIGERATWRLAGQAASGAAIPLAAQLNLTIAVAAVSSAVGIVTAYTYGYFVAVLLSAITAASLGLVSMPGLLADLESRGRVAAEAYLRTLTPLGAFLYAPLAAGAATLGRPVLDAVLEGPLDPGTVDLLWDVMRIFLVMSLLWVVTVPMSTAALALQRFRGLATVSIGGVLAHTGVVLALAGSGPRWVAAGHASVAIAFVAASGVLVFGAGTPRIALRAAARALPALALAAVFPLAALLDPGSWLAAVALAALALAAYVALAVVLWPGVAGHAARRLLAR